jgi:hypothetical protein
MSTTIKLLKHTPPPQPEPPVTYSLTGLTKEDVCQLVTLVDNGSVRLSGQYAVNATNPRIVRLYNVLRSVNAATEAE